MSPSTKKLDCLSTHDSYKIYQGESISGCITRNYYFINGVKCDAFGRTIGEPGYNPNNKQGQHVPVSYPIINQQIRTSGKKKQYPEIFGLSSSEILEIKKKVLKIVFVIRPDKI